VIVKSGGYVSDERVLFLLGIGGIGIRSLPVPWDQKTLSNLMYAFIYRLYMPAHFADPSYLNVKLNVPKNSVEYTLRIAPPQTDPIELS
jgi:hypothetical protein